VSTFRAPPRNLRDEKQSAGKEAYGASGAAEKPVRAGSKPLQNRIAKNKGTRPEKPDALIICNE